jgi:ribosomal-protein-alanine N-acetyltransferase
MSALNENIVIDIREMYENDVDAASRICKGPLNQHACRKKMLVLLRRSDCIGVVADHQGKILGFAIYQLLKFRFYLIDIVTRADFRRRGVASGMIKYIKSGISSPYTRIALDVRETNLSALLFFRHNGFRATNLNQRYCQETGEDCYRMYFP